MKSEVYRFYLRILSVCYGLAALLRVFDLLDLRLHFSRMGLLSQAWTLYLLFGDSLGALALWHPSALGNLIFVTVLLTQLVIFVGWSPYLQDSAFIVAFHLTTLTTFLILITYGPRELEEEGGGRSAGGRSGRV